jgi:hypothetical protein
MKLLVLQLFHSLLPFWGLPLALHYFEAAHSLACPSSCAAEHANSKKIPKKIPFVISRSD